MSLFVAVFVDLERILAELKLNIFSSKDAGLRLAMNRGGFINPGSEWSVYDLYSEKWFPYRTIASLHLWKSVD